MSKILKIVVLLTLVTSSLFAFETKVKTEIDKDHILPKEEVHVTIKVLAKRDANITFTHMEDLSGEKIVKRDGDKVFDTLADNNGKLVDIVTRTIVYTIKPEKDITIPSFLVKVNNKEYKTRKKKILIIKEAVSKEKSSKKEPKKEEKKSDTKEKKVENKEKKTTDKKSEKKAEKKADVKKDSNISKKTEKKAEEVVKEVEKKKPKPIKSTLKIEVSKKSVIVGEPLYVKVILQTSMNNISGNDSKIDRPNFKNFHVIKEQKGIRNDAEGNVEFSSKYYVVPTKEGNYTINTMAKLNDEIVPATGSLFGFFGNQNLNLHSNKVVIEVKPKPKGIDIVGDSYKMSYSVNKTKAAPDSEIVYKLDIEGYGDLSLLKEIKLNIPEASKIFDKDAKVKHKIKSGRVYSYYHKEFVIISDTSFTIPSTNLKAYSTRNKKPYSISVKPISITIISNKVANSAPVVKQNIIKPPKQNANAKVANVKNSNQNQRGVSSEDLLLDIEYYKKKIDELNSPYKKILIYILGLISGVLAAIFLPRLINLIKVKDEKSELYGSYHEALNILYPHTTKSTEIEEMVKELYEVTNGNKEIVIDNKKLDKLVKKVLKSKKL